MWKADDGAGLGESESDVRGIVVYLKKYKYYKMSLLSKLETFLNSVGNVSDVRFLEILNEFLDHEKKPKALLQLKEAMSKWKYHNYTNEQINNLVKEFIHTQNNLPIIDAEKFLYSKPYPDLEAFKNLTPEQLRLCLECDKKQWNSRQEIVYKINRDAYNPELLIWLIDTGFKATEWDLFEICRRDDVQLFKFYFERNIVGKITNCHILPIVIKNNNMDIFRYVVENDLICGENVLFTKKLIYENAISECIKSNNLEMMTMLYTKDEPYFKNIVVDQLYNDRTSYNVLNTASKEVCLWLWGNDMKWTAHQAELAKNKFMICFHE